MFGYDVNIIHGLKETQHLHDVGMWRKTLQNGKLVLEFLVSVHIQTSQVDDLDGNCLTSDVGLPQINRGEGPFTYNLVDVIGVVVYCLVEVLVKQHEFLKILL